MYGNFKKLMLENAHRPMKEQKQVYYDTFMDWKGSNDQVDDICIMGVKV